MRNTVANKRTKLNLVLYFIFNKRKKKGNFKTPGEFN